jgi:hypothetical protein
MIMMVLCFLYFWVEWFNVNTMERGDHDLTDTQERKSLGKEHFLLETFSIEETIFAFYISRWSTSMDQNSKEK